MNHTPQYDRPLTRIHRVLLVSAAVPMVAFGVLGGVGTFSNMTRAFGSAGTALGVIAAGEGATAVLAVLTLVLTAFSQSTPAMVRAGLWLMPLAASVVGAVTAPTLPLAAVQALTPMGMCVSAEGLALMVRRTTVYRTGIDPEQQRRTADTTRRLAYLRAVAAQHPDENTRRKAELKAWKVAGQAGAGDLVLGGDLVTVQRERLTVAADDALSSMFTVPPAPLAQTSRPVIESTRESSRPESHASEIPHQTSHRESFNASESESTRESSRPESHTSESSESFDASESNASSDDDEPVTPGSEIAYAVTLLADAPPAWDGLNLREAVSRADALVPGLTAPMLSAALREVGIETTPASIRSTRSALRRIGKTDV